MALRLLAHTARQVLTLVFPPLCAACGILNSGGSRWLCPACAQRIEHNAQRGTRCPRCSGNTEQRACTCDIVWDYPFERIFSLLDFDDVTRKLMHRLKYGGLWKLGFDLGASLAAYIPGEFWHGIDVLCPVPLHTARRLRRGYNQSDCIARGVLSAPHLARLRYEAHLLRRRRNTGTQTRLDKAQRQKNLANAITLNSRLAGTLEGKGVVLLDDVVTTGATTARCATTLLAGGATLVRVLSLVRD